MNLNVLNLYPVTVNKSSSTQNNCFSNVMINNSYQNQQNNVQTILYS